MKSVAEAYKALDVAQVRYKSLVSELVQIEHSTGLYLTDRGVDEENTQEQAAEVQVKTAAYRKHLADFQILSVQAGADLDALINAEENALIEQLQAETEYFNALYRTAASAAASRAEEGGKCLNQLIGRVIY